MDYTTQLAEDRIARNRERVAYSQGWLDASLRYLTHSVSDECDRRYPVL